MLEKERDYTRNFLGRSSSVVSWVKLVEVLVALCWRERGEKGGEERWLGWLEEGARV